MRKILQAPAQAVQGGAAPVLREVVLRLCVYERLRDRFESHLDPRGDIDVAGCRMRSCLREAIRQEPFDICEDARVEDLEQPSHAAGHDDNWDVLCDQAFYDRHAEVRVVGVPN